MVLSDSDGTVTLTVKVESYYNVDGSAEIQVKVPIDFCDDIRIGAWAQNYVEAATDLIFSINEIEK